MLPGAVSKLFLILGAAGGGIGVVLGAYAAHGLKSVLTAEKLAVFHTAVTYQMYHSLALILVGIWLAIQQETSDVGFLKFAGWGFFAGIVLFSGSLYGLSFGGPRFLGPITPLGGLLFISAWFALAVQAWRQ